MYRLFSILLVAVCLINNVVADESDTMFGDQYLYDKEFKEEKLVEEAVVLPAYPKNKNLVPIQLYHEKRKFYIDSKSISVSKKNYIARYTVIIESEAGVKNVIYESLRCNTRQFKILAYGDNSSKKFSMAQPSKWRSVKNTTGPYRYRVDLLDYYMCQKGVIRFKIKDIVRVLKNPPDLGSPDLYH